MSYENKISEPCDGASAHRESKASDLFNAICGISSILDNLEALKSELGIPCDPVNNKSPDQHATVALLMNEGGSAIREMTQRIHQSIESIKHELI
jgi:hypothetical protein